MLDMFEGFHANISLLARRKSTSALSYLEESAVPMRTTLPSELLGSMRTSLEPSADSNDPLISLRWAFFGSFLLEGGEFPRGDDHGGVAAAFDFALISTLE